MFRFGKKKIYTLGEKKDYFKLILKEPNISKKRREWAIRSLNSINKKMKNLKLGDVLIVNDKDVGAPKKKPRAVVVAKVKGNRVFVIPVRKENKIMALKNFDGQRILSLSNKKLINKSLLYEQRGFKLKNCNLTLKEKEKLQSKVKEYL